MKDERVIAIRETVFNTFALAEDNFESAVLLYESEKYRTSLPLFRDALLLGTKALVLIEMDEPPADSGLVESFLQSRTSKESGIAIDLKGVVEKLDTIEEETRDHPLKISEDHVKALDSCYKQIENFLAKTNKYLRKTLLTSQEEKRRRLVKKLALAISAALVLVIAAAVLIQFLLSLGHGLTGQYYADLNFEKLIKTRTDKKIDFDWGLGEVIDDFAESVTIRWTGRIKAPKPGTYIFITRSDDGARLWIDDKLVIDDWNVHAAENFEAKVNLRKGDHKIKVEYFEAEGFASMQLYWQIPGKERWKVISSSYLKRSE